MPKLSTASSKEAESFVKSVRKREGKAKPVSLANKIRNASTREATNDMQNLSEDEKSLVRITLNWAANQIEQR